MYPRLGTFVLIRPAHTFYERINISRAAVSRSVTPHSSMRFSSLSLLSATLRYRLPEGPPGSVAPSTSTCLARRVLPSCVKPWKVRREMSIPLFLARNLTIRSVRSSAPSPIRNRRKGLSAPRLSTSLLPLYHSSKSSILRMPPHTGVDRDVLRQRDVALGVKVGSVIDYLGDRVA